MKAMSKTPIDEFKRSLASATKAISGEPEMEVSFGGDVAGIVRDQVMLPSLPPKPKPAQIAKARVRLMPSRYVLPCMINLFMPKTSPAQARPARFLKLWSKRALRLLAGNI